MNQSLTRQHFFNVTLLTLREKSFPDAHLQIYLHLRFSLRRAENVSISRRSSSLGYPWLQGHVVKKRTPNVRVFTRAFLFRSARDTPTWIPPSPVCRVTYVFVCSKKRFSVLVCGKEIVHSKIYRSKLETSSLRKNNVTTGSSNSVSKYINPSIF